MTVTPSKPFKCIYHLHSSIGVVDHGPVVLDGVVVKDDDQVGPDPRLSLVAGR